MRLTATTKTPHTHIVESTQRRRVQTTSQRYRRPATSLPLPFSRLTTNTATHLSTPRARLVQMKAVLSGLPELLEVFDAV